MLRYIQPKGANEIKVNSPFLNWPYSLMTDNSFLILGDKSAQWMHDGC